MNIWLAINSAPMVSALREGAFVVSALIVDALITGCSHDRHIGAHIANAFIESAPMTVVLMLARTWQALS